MNRSENGSGSIPFRFPSAEEQHLVARNVDSRSGLESPTQQRGSFEEARRSRTGYDSVALGQPYRNPFDELREFNEINDPRQIPEDLNLQARQSPEVRTLHSEQSIIDTPADAYPDRRFPYQHQPESELYYATAPYRTNEGIPNISTTTVSRLTPANQSLRERRSSTDLRRTNAVK